MANKHKKKKLSDQMSTITMVTVLLVFLGLGIFAVLQSVAQSGEQAGAKVNINYEGQPSIGNANAPVKLVEFGDFKCPTCKAFHDMIYPQLKKDYIDTGKVQMTFINYQFLGEDSVTAGIAGESIFKQNPEAFWKFYDAIYTHQGKESEKWATPEFLVDLTKKNIPEVNAEQLSKDLLGKAYEKEVLADNKLAQNYKVDGVPAIFVNGTKLENGMDYEALKKAIDAELKKK
ncbi:DsbA family protein [Laceyella putida]|uniref:DsbA family protein n=1 Tax=Laceyella putida TaxID=110101 RepID=A0ABW2RPD6_9BACL